MTTRATRISCFPSAVKIMVLASCMFSVKSVELEGLDASASSILDPADA